MKIEIISTTRTALIDAIRHLMRGIEPAFLHDPTKPILISVDGPIACGKSLFPDAARAELMGLERDEIIPIWRDKEIWQGVAHEEEIELSFMNAHAPINTESFLAQRKHGGVMFVTNADDGYQQDEFYSRADIRIWLSPPDPGQYYERIYAQKMTGSSLTKTFNTMSGEWIRYVQIEVKDERLLSSSRFREAIDAIHANKSNIGIYEGDPALKTPPSFCP